MKKLLWVVLAAICLVLPLGIGRDFVAAADTQYMSVVATECFLYENPSFDTKATELNFCLTGRRAKDFCM